MAPFLRAAAAGLARAFLAGWSGYLLCKDPWSMSDAVAAAGIFLVSLAWSLWHKWQTHRLIQRIYH
jgi:hypothetical protein